MWKIYLNGREIGSAEEMFYLLPTKERFPDAEIKFVNLVSETATNTQTEEGVQQL